MTALDDLPEVGSFFGIDLRTGSMIVAAMGVVSYFYSVKIVSRFVELI